jgi:hypothetical protein
MKAKVVWAKAVWEVFEELPKKQTAEIVERVDLLRYFPHIYPLRTRGRFRRHRFFQAGNWLVFYKVVEGTIFIRGPWPARIP